MNTNREVYKRLKIQNYRFMKYIIFTLLLIILTPYVSIFSQSVQELKLNDRFIKDKSFRFDHKKELLDLSSLPPLSLNENSYHGLKKLKPKSKYLKRTEYIPYESKKHFGIAVGELAIVEFIPFAYSRWIKDWSKTPDEKNWTKISFESVWNNISSGYEYDTDNFLTNYFAHPYHGNLYFNTGRTNGYNFWESTAFAFAGSAIWEFFAETFRPSFNDWINTSVNGINFGETLYRLSGMITDNEAKGSERVWREIGGAIVNPVRGFNRLITGETYKIYPNPEYGRPKEFSIALSAGLRTIWIDSSTTGKQEYYTLDQGSFMLNVNYGNPFKTKEPFSHFFFTLGLTSGDPKMTSLISSGYLYGWDLKKNEKVHHKLKFDLEYNYTNNPGYLFGETALIPSLLSSFKIGKETSLITRLGFNGILMGGTPNDYDTLAEGRTYDLGPGIGARFGFEIRGKKWSYLTAGYSGSYIYTVSDPGSSKHYLQFAVLGLKYPIKDYFAIGLEGIIYWKSSNYDNYPHVYKQIPIVRLLFYTLM